jgi:hypothetical protein
MDERNEDGVSAILRSSDSEWKAAKEVVSKIPRLHDGHFNDAAIQSAFLAGISYARSQGPAEPKAVEDAYEVYKERNQFFVKGRDGVSVKDWNCNPYGFWHESHALDFARALSIARRDREGGAK